MWFDFQWAIALGVATLVAVRGWRKGSLDASGAAVAEVVGFLALGESMQKHEHTLNSCSSCC